MRFAAVFASLFVYILSCQSFSEEKPPAQGAPAKNSIKIFSPPERYMTYDERIKISGKVAGAAPSGALYLNGRNIMLGESGLFSAGAILGPGKNTVEIRYPGLSANPALKTLRVLRRIKFADAYQLFEGKPHWARQKLLDMATLGIIEAYPDGNFSPNNEITRAEYATWLSRAKDLKPVPAENDIFIDVPKQHWRAAYIQAVMMSGLMRERSPNYFGADDPVLRSEAIEIALKAQGIDPGKPLEELADDEARQNALSEQLDLAVSSGLIIGTSKQFRVFDTDRNITRAEAAQLLSRLSDVRKRLSQLNDWNAGYGRSAFCEVKALPRIISVSVTPETVTADGKSSVYLTAKVWDEGGMDGISVVKADLSDIGGPADSALFNDSSHGDSKAGDDMFTVVIPIAYEMIPGQKKIKVAVVDRNGWQAEATAGFTVIPPNFPPQVLSAIAFPPSLKPGKKTVLAVKVLDQNGEEDIRQVAVDLTALGIGSGVRLVDSGKQGDYKAGDAIFMTEITIPATAKAGLYMLPVSVTDTSGQSVTSGISLEIR